MRIRMTGISGIVMAERIKNNSSAHITLLTSYGNNSNMPFDYNFLINYLLSIGQTLNNY